MNKAVLLVSAAVASAAAAFADSDAGLRETGKLVSTAIAEVRSSKWLSGGKVPARLAPCEIDAANPDEAFASVAEPLRRRVKALDGANDVIVRVPPSGGGDVAAFKRQLRVALGAAIRAMPCDVSQIRDDAAMRYVFGILDDEALPGNLSAKVPYSGAGRALSCARFTRYNRQLRFYWFSDAAPEASCGCERISFIAPGKIERPVLVDMLTGGIFTIPADCVEYGEKSTTFKNIPMGDSPVMIADGICVPREVVWELETPYGIVDLFYYPGQSQHVMKALPPDGSQSWMKMKTSDFLPCFDKYGQFKWRDWPGKTKSDDDLKTAAEEEAKDLAAHPGPSGWDKFGGWAAGPQLEATGRFRTEKREGKWWLVDPEGRLFWSFGPVRVTPSSGMTPLNGDPCKPRRGNQHPLPDRDCLFAELPPPAGSPRATPFSKFWTTRDDLLLPFYLDRGETRIYDFSSANLYRKYGEDYWNKFACLAHRRLRSWGANTIANSSDLGICLMDRTPYAERVECESRTIAGSFGMWKKFRDPWDESFAAGVKAALEAHGREAHDPWCIGFFVDNEINWGATPSQLAEWTLQSPADQPAKKAAVDFLRGKYGEIGGLNAAWKADYAGWDDLLHSTLLPGAKAAGDLAEFTSVITETYFRKVREAVKSFDPQLLYLGCRFVGSVAKPWVIGPCAKYCDVVSYNIYLETLDGWRLPDGIDAPVMVGEFHFGATDRGPFGTGAGKGQAADQTDRAAKLKAYVRSALKNPQIVGVHWHQFSDQPASGRFDGEYLQVGWTDICDTPYPETIAAVREVGYGMYETRSGSFRIVKDIPYRDGVGAPARCRLDLKLPHTTNAFRTVVWFHGGGLTTGNRHFVSIDDSIAQVAVNYRLLGADGLSDGEVCIDDAAAAVAWTLRHIGDYGGDTNRVYVSGMSAGGYLTMMVGMSPKYLGKYGFKPTDLAGLVAISGQATKHFAVGKFAGDNEAQFLPKIDALAPLAWVGKDIPPILCVCGEPPYEWKCRSEENRLLVASCKALGHRNAKFVELPFCDHSRVFTAGLPYLEMFVLGRLP